MKTLRQKRYEKSRNIKKNNLSKKNKTTGKNSKNLFFEGLLKAKEIRKNKFLNKVKVIRQKKLEEQIKK